MRAHALLRALGRTRPAFEIELTSRLLVATMLIPLVEALFGWRAHTPFGVPLGVHALVLGLMVLMTLWPGASDSEAARVLRVVLWLPVPVFAIVFAVLLNARSNVFYTESALMEGMAALSAVHFAGGWLRRRALARSAMCLVEPAATPAGRFRTWWHERRCPRVRVMRTPAVRLSDAFTAVVGWSVFVSWALIALAHRHVAGPLLILAGVVASLAVVVLMPDALLGTGRRMGPRVTPQAEDRRPDHLVIVRGGAPPHAPHTVPQLRRRS